MGGRPGLILAAEPDVLKGSTLRRLGGYDLDACISAGATTHVYRARGPDAPGWVAVKLLAPALTVHPELVAAFREESDLSLQLHHPNLPQAITAGVSSGVPFLVMELYEGATVAELLERHRSRNLKLPVGAALAIARDCCRALGHAHHFVDSQGVHRQIIHGDVSPSNLLVCESGAVKLLDFGIARVAGPFDCDVTASGSGRHAYTAPEQARGEPIDRRVDVYAAGVVLHEMLTGKTPPVVRLSSAEVEAPSRVRPEVPHLVDGIVRRAMARDRAQRYPSGAAMARALEALAGLLHSRRRMAELVRELSPQPARALDQDTAPIEGVEVAFPDDWNRWDTARVDVS